MTYIMLTKNGYCYWSWTPGILGFYLLMSSLSTPVAWEDPGHSHTALDYVAYVQRSFLGLHSIVYCNIFCSPWSLLVSIPLPYIQKYNGKILWTLPPDFSVLCLIWGYRQLKHSVESCMKFIRALD